MPQRGNWWYSSSVPNSPAETMKMPSSAASIRYSGQCRRNVLIIGTPLGRPKIHVSEMSGALIHSFT